MKYKGYAIEQNEKRKDCKNKESGHEWSEYTAIPNSYSVYGRMALSGRIFKSIERAKEYVDFLIHADDMIDKSLRS
jgi:hypothetical protein